MLGEIVNSVLYGQVAQRIKCKCRPLMVIFGIMQMENTAFAFSMDELLFTAIMVLPRKALFFASSLRYITYCWGFAFILNPILFLAFQRVFLFSILQPICKTSLKCILYVEFFSKVSPCIGQNCQDVAHDFLV